MYMKLPSDTHQKMMSTYQLLQQDVMSISTFEHIRTLLKGIHPGLDEKLEHCSDALSKLQKIQSGDVITLSAEALPEDTEENKKRKKALLFFMSSMKDLKSEIQRINTEFTHANQRGNSAGNQIKSWGRIIGFAKGTFGIVTIAALIIIGLSVVFHKKIVYKVIITKTVVSPVPSPIITMQKSQIQVIIFNGKQIPLTQLYIGHGPDCGDISNPDPHYHALQNGVVIALDGTVIPDPEGCGYGKVKDVQVVQVSK